MTRPDRTVLITGASSGIGKATAHLLLSQGWKVIAAARTTEAMSDLRESGAEVLPLDISDIRSRQRLATQIHQKFGALDALVNNAGFGEVGPIETMPIQTAQNLFDVNVFGLIGLTQLLLPEMRKRGKGTVINLSSIAGRFVTPGAGWYGASKFAVEALSDALRLEFHQFGIKVVIIEPGLIATHFETVAGQSMADAQRDPAWAPMMEKVEENWQKGFERASPADVVAETIQKALNARTPKARYRCGHRAESAVIQRLLPTNLWDAILRIQMT
jgi:NADP-dependent 3-hydroxy acid dehydrogenase YdfG